MLEIAVEVGSVLVAVGDGDIAELYESWPDVYRVGARVGGVGVSHLQAEVLGIDIAHEVDGLEVAI